MSKALTVLNRSKLKNFRQLCQGPTSLMNLENKVALITGATSGIGLKIAKEMMKQNPKGVVLTGINKKEGEEMANCLNDAYGYGKCSFMELDVRKENDFKRVGEKVLKCFDGLDILVNNAGVLNDKEWEHEITVNIKGVLHGIFLAERIMDKGGFVLNISDIYGLEPLKYAPIYSSTKYAIVGLTRSYGDKEHSKKTKIRMAALCPGLTDTEMITRKNTMLDEKLTEKLEKMLHLEKLQEDEKVANAALYLAKNAESGTVWTIEKCVLYKVDFPNWTSFREKTLEVL